MASKGHAEHAPHASYLSELRAALTRPLPGVDAQLRMSPTPRAGWDPLKVPEGTQDGAALILIYPREGELHIPLTVRGSSLRNHTGQVSFPGGRVDEGETFEQAALREAEEEIGVPPATVELIGRLTPLHIPVSGYLLHPVVGFIDARPAFSRAEWEVARIIEPSLARLRDPATVKRERRTRAMQGRTIDVDVPYFDVDDEKVWGATAMILAELLAVVT